MLIKKKKLLLFQISQSSVNNESQIYDNKLYKNKVKMKQNINIIIINSNIYHETIW